MANGKLIQYLRKDGKPIGAMIAQRRDGKIVVSWSKVKRAGGKDLDTFSKKVAIEECNKRLSGELLELNPSYLIYISDSKKMPFAFTRNSFLDNFIERVKKYYKIQDVNPEVEYIYKVYCHLDFNLYCIERHWFVNGCKKWEYYTPNSKSWNLTAAESWVNSEQLKFLISELKLKDKNIEFQAR